MYIKRISKNFVTCTYIGAKIILSVALWTSAAEVLLVVWINGLEWKWEISYWTQEAGTHRGSDWTRHAAFSSCDSALASSSFTISSSNIYPYKKLMRLDERTMSENSSSCQYNNICFKKQANEMWDKTTPLINQWSWVKISLRYVIRNVVTHPSTKVVRWCRHVLEWTLHWQA